MIYLIVGGEYSDWYIEGYFTNKEDAEKYVVSKNAEMKLDELYIDEIEQLTVLEGIKKTKVLKHHEVVFDRHEDGWKMRKEPDRYEIYKGKKKDTKMGYNPYNKSIYVVSVTAEKREIAEKIAQDYLYKDLSMEYLE